MNTEKRAVIFALMAVLCWSTVATAFKLALEELSPRWMLTIAVISSWCVLSAVLIHRSQFSMALASFRSHGFSYARQALINPVFYYLILFEAYNLLPAQQAQAINYTWAITMSVLAVPLLGQKLFPRDIVALILAYLGVLVIATKGNVFGLEFESLAGVGLALLSTLLWAMYWILNTRAAQRGEQLEPAISLWASFTLAIPVLLAIAIAWDGAPFSVNEVGTLKEVAEGGEAIEPNLFKGIAASVYIGLFEMGITFLLWQTAMNLTKQTAAISSLIFLSPFLSLIFISRILGEPVHMATLVGLVLIIAGLVIQKLSFGKKKTPVEQEEALAAHE
ncbi:DMT family transporter [Oceanobacter kriegii]|uniref:DMT family transporter n=1 Tax=Oceanobacter kriegii TaxID=64972 RepID=UPI0003FAF163|nr:DMT family transporter [Oceanobacter kriegii]